MAFGRTIGESVCSVKDHAKLPGRIDRTNMLGSLPDGLIAVPVPPIKRVLPEERGNHFEFDHGLEVVERAHLGVH
jgi:hypothetical protein